jgi:hypothetical protein
MRILNWSWQRQNNTAHDWMMYGHLNVLCMLLGQQACYTKYPCFMREWGSRARSQHWKQKHWAPKTSLEHGSKNILRKNPVDPKKILLLPLHIKLDIIKQFDNTLSKTGNHFKYLCKTTGYGLDGPGIESRWRCDFSHTSRLVLGPTQPPVQWVQGLPRG